MNKKLCGIGSISELVHNVGRMTMLIRYFHIYSDGTYGPYLPIKPHHYIYGKKPHHNKFKESDNEDL